MTAGQRQHRIGDGSYWFFYVIAGTPPFCFRHCEIGLKVHRASWYDESLVWNCILSYDISYGIAVEICLSLFFKPTHSQVVECENPEYDRYCNLK